MEPSSLKHAWILVAISSGASAVGAILTLWYRGESFGGGFSSLSLSPVEGAFTEYSGTMSYRKDLQAQQHHDGGGGGWWWEGAGGGGR